MDNHLTPEQAREQLDAASQASITAPRDRSLHAGGTALVGLALGVSVITSHTLDGAAKAVTSAAIWGLALLTLLWVQKRARTTPLRSERWSRIGFGCSFVLALAVVLPWLNMRAQDGPVGWPLLLAGAALVTVPCLVAAVRIATDR